MTLVTLTDYKRAIRETDSSLDTYHQDALDAAEQAILNFTDRDFGADQETSDRTYEYDGSGVLNIDDCDEVNSVTWTDSEQPLPAKAWRAESEGPVGTAGIYAWLKMPVIDWRHARRGGLASLGEMGFTQNLDTFIAGGGFLTVPGQPGSLDVTVNANWGWPTVPKDVQRATIFTAMHLETITPSSGEGGGLASKSVAEVAESYFQEQAAESATNDPVPPIAVALLLPYQRH